MTAPAPPEPPRSPRPPLRRPRDGRILGGVAAGLSDHLGVDVALVRIALVVLALFNGIGVVAYLVGWLAIPAAAEGEPRPAPPRRAGELLGGREPIFWIGLGLLILGALALVTGPLAGVGLLARADVTQLLVPLVLIGFGLALWRAGGAASPSASPASGTSASPSGGASGAGTSAPETNTVGSASEARRADVGQPTAPLRPTHTHPRTDATMSATTAPPQGPTGGGSPPGPPAEADHAAGAARWTPPPSPERARSLLTRVTLGLALVAVGVLWLLDLGGVIVVGGVQLLSVALLVVGLGLLVGSVAGRGRWLILIGALLAPLVLIAQLALPGLGPSVAAWSDDGRFAGELDAVPSSIDELEPSYRYGAGSVRLDLTELEFDGETVVLGVEVGAGEVRVVVPDDVEVAVTGRVGIGQVLLLDERASGGVGVGALSATQLPDDARGRVELDLSAGVGQVEVDPQPAVP